MNITDVEDKIIRNAVAQKKELSEYTQEYEKAFLEDARMLRLQQPERLVRATEHIQEMAEAIQELDEKGFTYRTDGSIYFRISKFPEYGKLAHLDLSGMRAGARVDVDEYEKDDARDFVLWKTRKEGEPFWETAVGSGRPGWHIECSVMAMKYLGDTLDIHAGGVDLTFPHHENEIAQSEALTGKQFVRYWMHSEHLIVEGQKMSKSLNNFYTLRDILGMGYQPEVVRYLLASVPYRKKLNFTFDGLKAAATSIDRLRNFRLRLETSHFGAGLNEKLQERSAQATQQFDTSLDDDLNTAEALAAVFDYVRDINTAVDTGEFLSGNVEAAKTLLARFDLLFDVLQPSITEGSISDAEVEALVAERIQAKKSRNFARSDEIRNSLSERGVILEDTKEGSRWKRK
jgi:cysteinyl-tRNA synthetase